MGRKIIVQERIAEPSDFNFKVVFWLEVPAERQIYHANTEALSSVKGISGQELQDIKDGKVYEVSHIVNFPAGTGAVAIKESLVSRYNTEQSQFNARNPWKFFGTSWNGTAWTNAGVN